MSKHGVTATRKSYTTDQKKGPAYAIMISNQKHKSCATIVKVLLTKF